MRRTAMYKLLAVVLFAFAPACGGEGLPAAGPHDGPEPAHEPRETLRVSVDLERSGACEEQFDLAIYASRAVELIAWEPSQAACTGRQATIRFFPRRTTREALLELVKQKATRAEAVPEHRTERPTP